MKKTIIIKPTHELVEKTQRNAINNNIIGVVGEKNSTILEFVKPLDINGDNIENYTMRAVFNNKSGSYSVNVVSTELVIGPELTTDTELVLSIQFLKNSEVKWESFPLKFHFIPGSDDSGENLISKAKSEQRESDRTELGNAIGKITEDDNYRSEQWEKLIESVNGLTVLNESNKKAIENNKLICFLFEHSPQPPSVLYGDYNIELVESEYIGEDGLITLPYLYTPNAQYSARTKVSKQIRNIAIDVSGVTSTFNETWVNSGAYITWLTNTNVEEVYLTGTQNIQKCWYLFANSPVSQITLLQTGEKREDVEYAEHYYKNMFSDARNLQYIFGTPIDFGISPNENTFSGCASLRYFQVKPKSIVNDFDVGTCPSITRNNLETITSILNGCRDWVNVLDTPSITLTFPAACKADFDEKCYFNTATSEYISGLRYNQLSAEEKSKYAPGVSYLSAFVSSGTTYITGTSEIWYEGKGVSIAWKT